MDDQVRTMKLAAVSAMVGALLLLGAFLITSSMVSAQTPPVEPTPSATEPATPQQAPGGDSEGERNREDCPKEDGANGESSSGARGGGGPRSFSQ
ncbi:MAG: hypothetical protein GEU75_02410 [Dehalococcoidia bacterium]|nr:hypothetical protein [Dehalococcoidia bacterium]